MTLVQVMVDSDAADVRLRTDDAAVIGVELAKRGIVFQRWSTTPGVDGDTPSTEILASYEDHVARLNADGRYKYIDVARLHRQARRGPLQGLDAGHLVGAHDPFACDRVTGCLAIGGAHVPDPLLALVVSGCRRQPVAEAMRLQVGRF